MQKTSLSPKDWEGSGAKKKAIAAIGVKVEKVLPGRFKVRDLSARGLTAAEHQVKDWHEDVIPAVWSVVVVHVIGPREAKTWGQPAIHVNPPMDLFCGN